MWVVFVFCYANLSTLMRNLSRKCKIILTKRVHCETRECFSTLIYIKYNVIFSSTVPRKVLIDRFESTPEPDEPLQIDDLEPEQEELYDEDQFYKESDMSPGPAPKLQGDLAKKSQRVDPVHAITSSVSPPQRTRDDSSLEGSFLRNRILINQYLHWALP